ncbi:MAG: hypothetical protein R3Y58_07575 [Eubacteriales bacterium]
MNVDFKQFKEHCVDYYIFDAYQYAEGMMENMRTAAYCKEMIDKLIGYRDNGYAILNDNIANSVAQQMEEKGSASVGLTVEDLVECDNFEILGISVSCGWLLGKYIKDFFQYIKNSYDSVAQVINFALIAGDNYSNKPRENTWDNEKVQFSSVLRKFCEKYQSDFPLTYALLERISIGDEYKYICDYNNRTKHIKSIDTKISNQIMGSKSIYKVLGFEKNNIHSDEDIHDLIQRMYDFTDDCIEQTINTITIESKQRKFTSNRIHDLKYYFQLHHSNPASSFTIVFLKTKNSIRVFPNEIKVLAVRKGKDTIVASNISAEVILVCTDDGRVPSNCVGSFILKKQHKDDGLYHYNTYEKDLSGSDNKAKYYNEFKKDFYQISTGALSGSGDFVS